MIEGLALFFGMFAFIPMMLGFFSPFILIMLLLWMRSRPRRPPEVPGNYDPDDYHKKLLAGPCKKE